MILTIQMLIMTPITILIPMLMQITILRMTVIITLKQVSIDKNLKWISIEVTAYIEYDFKLVPNWKTIFWIVSAV